MNRSGSGQPDEFATQGRCEKRLPEHLHRRVFFLVLSCHRAFFVLSCQWKLTKGLADRLFISQKTVKNHLANIYEKLDVHDRAQAAVEAIRLGLKVE